MDGIVHDEPMLSLLALSPALITCNHPLGWDGLYGVGSKRPYAVHECKSQVLGLG